MIHSTLRRRLCSSALILSCMLAVSQGSVAQEPSRDSLEKRGLNGLIPIPFAKISQPHISALGREALKIRSAEWLHAETPNFVLHYFDGYVATPVSVEAEAYYRVIAKDLGCENKRWERKCHVFVFQSETDWADFGKRAALDPWTGGIHSRGELFILRRPEFKFKGHLLAHEVTHLVLDRFFGSNIPLWLNEGFAEYAGGRAYASFMRARGYGAKPSAPLVAASDYIPLADLVFRMEYPVEERKVAAFYAQSHRLVRFLASKDKEEFQQLFAGLAGGRIFESALFQSYGTRFDSIKTLEKVFKPYATGGAAGED